jgi:ABC-type sugar transport system substrate-binding protein
MSEKTIADKMFLRTAKSMLILNGNVHPGMVSQMPAELAGNAQDKNDVVLLFALNRKELELAFPAAKERLGDKGSLWVAYLKQTASKATDINRDTIRAYAEENGITTVAMISVDGDWSAMRMKRIEI